MFHNLNVGVLSKTDYTKKQNLGGNTRIGWIETEARNEGGVIALATIEMQSKTVYLKKFMTVTEVVMNLLAICGFYGYPCKPEKEEYIWIRKGVLESRLVVRFTSEPVVYTTGTYLTISFLDNLIGIQNKILLCI